MSSESREQQPAQAGEEFYSISDETVQREYVGVRRATRWVPFFLPHLKPGMRLLDCGCGVGSITLDLAEIVAPAQVIGLDRDESQLEVARKAAQARAITNVTFEVGNVYELAYADGSFDAALAHTLLFHLSDPLQALRSMRRVLRPGGIVAISDDDYSTFVASPDNAPPQQFLQLVEKFILLNGGSPRYSHHLRGLILEAGFAESEGHLVAAEYYGTLAETRRLARLTDLFLQNPDFATVAVEQGWQSEAQLASLRQEVLAWGERPDAFLGLTYCAALGWVTPRSD